MGMMEKIDVQTSLAREYLTFRLGDEEYGIDILKVQEIRGYENPTRIANAPHFLKGVVNLRGTIVPIVDLRMRFGCSSSEYNTFTVMEIPADAIRSAPEMSSAIDATYIRGLAQVGERMVILLDIESMLMSPDMGLID